MALLLCLTGVSVAQGADPGSAGEPKPTDPWEQFPPAWERALRTLGDDSLYLLTSPLRFDVESGLVTGGIVAGIVGLSFADRAIRRELAPHRHDSVRDAADDLSYLGNAGVLVGLNVGAIAVGERIKEYGSNTKLLDAARGATEAQLLTAGFTEGLAYGTRRSRPGASNDPFDFKFKSGGDPLR